MYAPVKNPKENKSRAVANSVVQKQCSSGLVSQFVDNRPEIVAKRKLHGMLQNQAAQQRRPIQRAENKTGLPENLKSGMEHLSGINLDPVKVHYNSNKPAAVQAHAYAQGNDIHLASGQEKHLPHELGHVVQQAQGRVKPTTSVNEMVINDNVGLEKEADSLGVKALQMKNISSNSNNHHQNNPNIGLLQLRTLLDSNIIQKKETTPSVSSGVDVDLIGNARSVNVSYAISVIKKELLSETILQGVLVQVLSYALNQLVSLSNWISMIKNAYTQLKAIASIPNGVLAVFLWGIGKLFLLFANKVYNNGKLSYVFGEITEDSIYGYLHSIDTAQKDIQYFIGYIESINNLILKWLGSGNAEEKVEEISSSTSSKVEDNSTKFIKLNVASPELSNWTDLKNEKRAGLIASASAHINLLGQTMGGDVDVKLPFGTGWELNIKNFFESSPINLTGLHIESIKGDYLNFSNEGLESVAMSVNALTIKEDIVIADVIQVAYNKGDNSIAFTGNGSAKIWGDERLPGTIILKLGTDGSFKEAHIGVGPGPKFSAIPNYLDVTSPIGSVDIFADKSPNLLIAGGIIVKGLPGGIGGTAEGGVKYQDSALSGYLTNLDVMVPLFPGAELKFVIVNAQFNADEITAANAFVDFNYTKPSSDDKQETIDNRNSTLLSGLDFTWLEIPGVGINALAIHQGMNNLKFANGKFTGTKDNINGLTKLNARVLGIYADYDKEAGTGSLTGEYKKQLSSSLPDIFIPIAPGIHAYMNVGGYLGFDASVKAEFAKDNSRSDDHLTYLVLNGKVDAMVKAGLNLAIGASVGVPYLATLNAAIIGGIGGEVKGNLGLSGAVKFDNSKNKIEQDVSTPTLGIYDLTGLLKADVTGQIKGKVLVFEHEIASVKFGEWVLGEYNLKGKISADSDGKPEFTQSNQSGFTSDPLSPDLTPKPIPIDEWLNELAATNTHIEYKINKTKNITLAARNIIYGAYSLTEKSKIKSKYLSLLKNSGDQTSFNSIYTELIENVPNSGNQSSTFVWTSSLWGSAVDKRTVLFFFEQSRSKKTISCLLKVYHSMGASDYEDRIRKLDEIVTVIDHYINNRSKVPSNKNEAKQLENQIGLEKVAIKIKMANV